MTSPVLCSPQATATVCVHILDENDNHPAFRQQQYETTLDEGPFTLNSFNITVSAADQDEGPNGTVTYAIVDGNIYDTFAVHDIT
ncbi:hypothetical protein scyTo_0024325, partial [Scyliorhinus torazame]|nr:hypothetical protein [Scyliorhinus torazame]